MLNDRIAAATPAKDKKFLFIFGTTTTKESIMTKQTIVFLSLLAMAGSVHAEGPSYDYANPPNYLKRMYMPSNLKGDIRDGLSASWDAGVSLDMNVKDVADGFDSLGDNIQLRDLRLSGDILYSIFGLRATLEDNYEDSLKISDSDLQQKLREFYVGMNAAKGVIVLFGRMDKPGTDQVTQRAITINDPIARLNLDNQRYLVGTIQVTPEDMTILKNFSGVLKDLRIEISAFNDSQQSHLRIGEIKQMRSYALSLQKIICNKVFAKLTYVDSQNGSRSLSGLVRVAPLYGFIPYAQMNVERKDPIHGDTDTITMGVAKNVWGDKNTLYVEGSRIKTRNSTKIANGTQNNATIGLSHKLNDYVDVYGEYTTNVATPAGSVKDHSVWVGAKVHRKDSSSSSTLFSNLKKK